MAGEEDLLSTIVENHLASSFAKTEAAAGNSQSPIGQSH